MKKNKHAVIKFFDYVEQDLLPKEETPDTIQSIKDKLSDGRELIASNEWGIAFENLADELVENFIVLNREGISIAKEVVEGCGLHPDWIVNLRGLFSDGYVYGSWRLVDGEKLAAKNKYTFYKPSKRIIERLEPGNLVKLMFQFKSRYKEDPSAERMWVTITEQVNGKFKGTLENSPVYLGELFYKDVIEFEAKHIIDHDLDISEPNLVDLYYDRCFVTNKILYENAPVNYMYREAPLPQDDNKDYKDSGWRFFSGDETDAYVNNPDNLGFVSLGAILSRDDSFVDLLEADIGTSYERNMMTGKFEFINEEET